MRIGLRDPGRAATIAIAVLALLVAGSAFAVRLVVPGEDAVIRTERWGWTSDGVEVEPTSDRSPFRAGDLVVAIEGRSLDAWVGGALPFGGGSPGSSIGDRINVDVVRAGQPVRLEVPLVPFSLERIGGAPVGAVLLAVAMLALASVLVIRRPRSTALRLLFVIAAVHVVDVIVWEIGLRPTDFVRSGPFLVLFAAGALFNLVFWSAIIHLLALFPTRSPVLAARPGLVPVLYAGPIVALGLLAVGARLAGGSALDWIDRLAGCQAIVATTMLVGIVGSVVAGYRRSGGTDRASVRWVAASLILAATATLALLTIPIIVTGTTLVPRNVVDLIVLPVPVALILAVARNRLFQVALLTRSRERIVAAREDERRKLRRDLHDGLAPALAAVGLKLDLARESVRTDPAVAEATIEDVRQAVRDVISDIRRLSRELRPPSLDSLGLAEAVRQQADALSGPAASGPRFVVTAAARLPALPAAVEVAAYRIAVEGMMNVVRHAGATTCEVRVELVGNELEIEVADDGRGLDPGAPGVGMRSMLERAAEVGGDVTISPRRGRGTNLLARLPVDLALAAGPA